MKKNKILRMIAGIIGIGLIILILVFTNAFLGNPISSAMAKNAAQKHIARNYGDLDLRLEKPAYNFKFNEYMIKAYSESSRDSHFTIYYSGGDIRDDYQSMVVDRFNTISRLEDEYEERIRELLGEKTDYEDGEFWVNYDKDLYDKPGDFIKLDMDFDKSLPVEAEVTINIGNQDLILEETVKLFKDSHRLFEDEGYKFSKYNLSWGEEIPSHIYGVKPSQIRNDNLLDLFNRALGAKDGEYEGISVFMKK